MKRMLFNIDKFSISQMTSNTDGKTSGTGTMGVLICTVGAFCFFVGCIDKIFFTHDVDILVQSIIFTGIGAGMLGYRKSQEKHLVEKDAANDTYGDQPLNS